MKLGQLALTLAIALAPFSPYAFADDNSSMNLDAKKDTGPFSGGAEGNLNLSSGNTNIKTYGASAFMDYKGDVETTRVKLGFMQNTTDYVERARRLEGTARTGFNITNNVDFFALGTYMQNPFKGLANQEMLTPGIGIYPVNTDDLTLRIEGGAGYMWENYYPSLIGSNNFTVATAGFGGRFKLSDVADFTDDFVYILPVSTTRDWRMNNTVAITSALTKHMALKLAYTVEFRHIPVTGYKDNDNFTTAALVFKL